MNRTIHKMFLAAGICLLATGSGYAQQQLGGTTADKKMQGSGSSGSAMGGLYSPSLYDGTANINIPIYQFSADGGNYGISLGYNTRGVRVDELAGDIGIHFNLNTNSIQRIVKDIPDELYAENYDDITVGSIVLITPEKKLRGRLVVYGENLVEAAEDSVYRDHESDDYMVSVGSLSFTFNLGKNGYVFTIPERNVKVELLRNNDVVTWLPSTTSMGTLKFRITDEQGNQYLFTGGDYTYENVKDKYGEDQNIGSYYYCKSWVIEKVTTVSGAEIHYNYSLTSHSPASKAYSDVQFDALAPGGSEVAEPGYYARLDSINYPNGVTAWFKFDVAGNRKDDYAPALREIQLLNNGQTQLRYKMNQSYFVASGLVAPETDYDHNEIAYGSNGTPITYRNYRLRLDSVSIVGQTGPEELFYKFEYSPIRLPKRFDGSQDYFGYYNGKVPVPYYSGGGGADPDLSIPYHTPFSSGSMYGVDKTPDTDSARACILTKIKNAYGGQVEFRYGSHVLANVMNSTNTPGLPTFSGDNAFLGETANDGLRLDTIVEKDIFHVENYMLTVFGYSGGQRFLSGGYFRYPHRLHFADHTPATMLMTNQYVSRHQLVAGANHGYSVVTVKQVDQNNNQLSRTAYTFTNFKMDNDTPRYQRVGAGSKYFFTFPYSEKQFLRDWEMGLPLSVKEYDQNDYITLETNNTYTFSIDSTSSSGKIENTRIATLQTDFGHVMNHIPNAVDSFDTYRPFRGKAQLVSSQVKKYVSDNTFVNDAVTYEYDGHNNIKYTLTSNSRGEYFKTENIYNYNLDVLLGSGLQAFTDAGLEKVVSTQRWKTDVTGSQHLQLMDGFISTFDYSSQELHAKRMYNLVPGVPVTRNQYTGYSGSGPIPNPHHKVIEAFQGTVPQYFRLASEVLLSDAKGNPLESRIGDQDQFKAMIWDDIDGKKLAEAGNCHYADIAYCGFETPGTGTVTRGNVTYNGTNVLQSTVFGSLYQSAFSLTAVSGIEGSQVLTAGKEYLLSFWVAGSGLPSVYSGSTWLDLPDPAQDYNNFKYFRIRFTASSGDKFKIQWPGGGAIYIDEVRLQPADAQMQSWNHTRMFGAATSSDGNGKMSFVEYDGQGRPSIVRDKDGNVLSKTDYGIQ